jgi:hypothetical protein
MSGSAKALVIDKLPVKSDPVVVSPDTVAVSHTTSDTLTDPDSSAGGSLVPTGGGGSPALP